jgi:hypothetical protein
MVPNIGYKIAPIWRSSLEMSIPRDPQALKFYDRRG